MMNKTFFHKTTIVLSSFLLCLPLTSQADVLDLSDSPLAVSTTVEPNVMMLLDDSGSMRNIIWDIERNVTKADGTIVKRSTIAGAPAPYDPNTTYPSWGFTSTTTYTYSGGTLTRTNGVTKSITFPNPYSKVQAGWSTWWSGNYFNYIFNSYADGTNLTDTVTNYWFPNESRMGAVRDASVNLVTTVPNVRFGIASFTDGQGGDVHAECGSNVGTLVTEINKLVADGSTPLAESYYELTRYFRGLQGYDHGNNNDNGSTQYTSPIQYRCQQNFVVALTDGLPTNDSYFPSSGGDPDITSGCNSADGTSATPPCLPDWDELHPATSDPAPYPQYSDGTGGGGEGGTLYLDDLAKFGYDLDLRTDPVKSGASGSATDAAGVSFDDLSNNGRYKTQNLKTYAIGFTLSNQMLEDAGYYGQDPVLDASGNPKVDGSGNVIKKAGYYTANDTSELATAFGNIIKGIQQTTGSAAAVAASTGFISKETLLFQALYDSNNWEGRLRSFQLDPLTRQLVKDGSGNPLVLWEAGEKLTNMIYTNRFIMTYGKIAGAGNPTGYLFDWNNLDSTNKTELTYVDPTDAANTTDDKYIFEYIIGDRSRETLDSSANANASGIFRSRGKLITIDVPDPAKPGFTKKQIVEYNSNILGDIVNSSPVYIGRPNMPYNNRWNEEISFKKGTKTISFTQTAQENATGVESYSDFKKRFSGLNPTAGYDRNEYATLYVGANDGMLHAFDATNTATGGEEKFAYIPSPVIKNLAEYSNPSYAHKFYADGAPNAIDAFYKSRSGNVGWHTTLAAGLNNGGQGIYVLDVTDPKNDFGKSSTSAANLVQWEFTDKDDADLGFTFAQPAIVRMANGKWAAIFGNGYNNTADNDNDGTTTNDSTTGNAVLYIAYLEGPGSDGKWNPGTDFIKIDTGVGLDDDIDNPTHPNYHGGGTACNPGSTAVAGGTGTFDANQSRPNGMSTVTVIDTNSDFIADFIYAGDLYGNMWKFDVRDRNTANWESHITSGSTPLPLFKARTGTCPQPITSQPAVISAKGGSMVLFGTGKFIETTDTDISLSRAQTFYGLVDTTEHQDTPVPHIAKSLTSTAWIKQYVVDPDGTIRNFTNTDTSVTYSESTREVTKNGPNDGKFYSWFMDLPTKGERVIYEPFVRGIFSPKIIFVTAIPTSDVCSAGGTSWLMELDARDGTKTEKAVFDLNYDGKLDASDNSSGANPTVLNGWKLPGIATAPTVIATDTVDIKIMSTSTGSLELRQEAPSDVKGRQSWRQIK